MRWWHLNRLCDYFCPGEPGLQQTFPSPKAGCRISRILESVHIWMQLKLWYSAIWIQVQALLPGKRYAAARTGLKVARRRDDKSLKRRKDPNPYTHSDPPALNLICSTESRQRSFLFSLGTLASSSIEFIYTSCPAKEYREEHWQGGKVSPEWIIMEVLDSMRAGRYALITHLF